jgi:hypothetical protein
VTIYFIPTQINRQKYPYSASSRSRNAPAVLFHPSPFYRTGNKGRKFARTAPNQAIKHFHALAPKLVCIEDGQGP